MAEMEDPATSHWHIDKRINISILLGLLGFAISVFLWGSSVEERVSVLTLQDQWLERRISDNKLQYQGEVSRLERRFDRLDVVLIRIEDKLDQKEDKGNER